MELMNNNLTTNGHPVGEQNFPEDTQQQKIDFKLNRSDTEGVISNVRRETKRRTISIDLNEIPSPQHRSYSDICGFTIFTCIVMTIGIITVCVTSSKQKDETCQMTFKRSAKRAIGYDSTPVSVAVGDFNKDGHVDIAVANSGADNIGIFIGYGNGTFANQITYPTELRSRPYAIVVGDFNNDTLLDIAIANYGTNSIGVLIGYTNGSFTNQIITSLGSSQPLALAIGDFNNDNQLDLAVANYGTSNVSILLGFNNGSFRIHSTYNMGYDSIPYSLVVGDFNNDSQLDIATVNYGTSELAILLADKNEMFVMQKYSTGTGSHPCSLDIGDFNEDNVLDIAVANFDASNIGIFLGNKNGTFTNIIKYSSDSNFRPKSIVVNDFNNDTKLDIAVIDSGNNNLILLQGDGNGNFSILTTQSNEYNFYPCSIAIGDFDSDNRPDVVITNNFTNNIFVLTAYTMYPTTNQTTYFTGTDSNPTSVAVGDFNNDNLTDISVVNQNSDSVGIFINLGDGIFANQIEVFIGKYFQPDSIAVGDVNNDKQLDIIIAASMISEIRILIGYGNGTFRLGDLYSTGRASYPWSIAVGDFNNDCNLDIVVANAQASNIGIFFGYGDGNFTSVSTYLTEIDFQAMFVAISDFNNDKILDIAVSSLTETSIAILMGYGNGSFQIPPIVSTNSDRPLGLAIGDLNNDHQLDIVYVSPYSSNVGILWGYGNGTFGNITIYSTESSSWPLYVTLGHFNNDALLDIVVNNAYAYEIGIFFGLKNGSFTPQKTFSTGYNSFPASIATSDFNHDNQLDIVVSNQYANNIGVFLIYYETNFASETTYFTGSGPHPYSVAIGDFNKDNQSDIVVANTGNDVIQLLLDYNEGTFTTNKTYSTGLESSPQFVTVADFNRDNQLDIAVANVRGCTIDIFLGYDNGTFDTGIVYSTGSDSFPTSIGVGDFNEDNWTDIAVVNIGLNNIDVYLGFDYATFTNETIHISGLNAIPLSVAANDFNNDHYCDIVVTNFFVNSVDLYLGYGNGTFAKPESISTENFAPNSIAIGDFNGDNHLDFVVTFKIDDNIGIFLGYENRSFQSQITYSTGDASYPLSTAIGDFNKDNILDLVVANRDSNNIGIFIGYGNGTFAEQIPYMMPNESMPVWVTVNDLNNDSFLDIAVANYGLNNIGIYYGHGNGSFRDMVSLFTEENSGPNSIGIGDLNKDGWMDIAVANSDGKNVGIFFGYGNDTFSSQITYSTGSQSNLSSITIHDLNNDTYLDIIVSDFGEGNGNVGVFYGYGNGNFTMLKTYSTGWNSNPISIAICDFNSDNRLDLAVANPYQDIIDIMLRSKSEPFSTPLTFSTGNYSRPRSVAVGDFNMDNHLDIVVVNFATNNIGIFLGIGNATFGEQRLYSTGNNSQPVSIAIGDFNNDNNLDIAVASPGINRIVIFHGYGDGTFVIATTYSTGIDSAPCSIAVNDLNKDNYLDIVVVNIGSNDVLIFFGSKNGTFLEPKSYSLDYGALPRFVAIGDMNNDNLLDIVVANSGTDYVEILIQTC